MLSLQNTNIYSPQTDPTQKETIFIFTSPANRNLTTSSNYPYELWLDNKFIGQGGHRCTKNECYADNWGFLKGTQITIKLHWMNPQLISVWYRCLFDIIFFIDFEKTNEWEFYYDKSIKFGSKICSQLPSQMIITSNPIIDKINIDILNTIPQNVRYLPVKKNKYINVNPKLISAKMLGNTTNEEFNPININNIVEFLQQNKINANILTYDLGYIALYRFSIQTHNKNVTLCYSEIADFDKIWESRSRQKVFMGDSVGKNTKTSLFGLRGCRYLHVIFNCSNNIIDFPIINIQRSEYDFDWKNIESNNIIDAVKNNLIACVDGGLVDTCWRERTQWIGDVRMSTLALKLLTNNTEVIDFVLDQIAESYDCNTGLVSGAYPTKTINYKLEMPLFHLAFCLTVLENNNTGLPYNIVLKSIEFWKNNYLKNGLIKGVPGWYFIDWDKTNDEVIKIILKVNILFVIQCLMKYVAF
jgi:hypothetical protein